MPDIARRERVPSFANGRCDERIFETLAIGKRIVFDKTSGDVPNRFAKRQDSKAPLLKKLASRSHLQLGFLALLNFHQRDDRNRTFRGGVN